MARASKEKTKANGRTKGDKAARAGGSLQVPLEVVGGTFLGTLRGGHDTVELTGVFAKLFERFEELRSQFAAGVLDDKEFGRALVELVCTDREGNYWTLGASSSQWYRKIGDEGEWVATPVDYAIEMEARGMLQNELTAGTGIS